MVEYLEEKVMLDEDIVVKGLTQVMSARKFVEIYLASNSTLVSMCETSATLELDGDFITIEDL